MTPTAPSLPRRRVLQFGALLPLVLSPCPLLATDPGLTLLELRAPRGPWLAAGDLLLLESSVQAFTGEGLYLYPAWGQPQVYAVKRNTAGDLEFRCPGEQRLAWTAAAALSQAFAGRVREVVPAAQRERSAWLQARHRRVRLPDLPPG